MRLELAAAFAGSILLGCSEPTTSPTPQRFESGPRQRATITVGSFTLSELGSLSGGSGDFSEAHGVNGSGAIVGASHDSTGVSRATLWPADGSAPRDLGSFNNYWWASADAINAAGDIVGASDNGGDRRITLWPAGGGPPRDLGSLPDAYLTEVHAINDAGDVIGVSHFPDADRATLWPRGGPPRDIGSLGPQAFALGINSAGAIVGLSVVSTGQSRATLWPAGGGAPRDLGSLGFFCEAHGINDAGDVVGGCAGFGGDLAGATLWPGDGSPPRYLETSGGMAIAINNAGDIIGSIRVGGEEHAAFWPADGSGMQDLGTLAGDDLSFAAGINSNRRIVGFSQSRGTVNPAGYARAVVWAPVLLQQPQSITFASSPPNGAIVGGTYTVSATGGGSGNAVTLSSLAPTVCSVAGNVVSLDAGGTCVIAADQAGSAAYFAAPQVTQSFNINTRPVANAGAAQTGNEGSTITFSAGNSSDPDGDALIAYTWDFGDGTVQSVSSPSVTHTYSDNKPGGGAYAVSLQVTDARGTTSAVANTSALIGNIAPVATFDAPSPVGEGTMNLSLTGAQDAPGDVATLQYAFDCGNGTGGIGAFSLSSSISCVVPDNGVRTVRARIKDKDGALTEYTKSVTVVNAAPTIAITSAPASGKTGVDYTLQFKFTDPGTGDAPWIYQITWGDGKPATSPKSVTTQGLAITEKHRYTKAGSYTITVRVTDKDGGAATVNVPVTIVK